MRQKIPAVGMFVGIVLVMTAIAGCIIYFLTSGSGSLSKAPAGSIYTTGSPVSGSGLSSGSGLGSGSGYGLSGVGGVWGTGSRTGNYPDMSGGLTKVCDIVTAGNSAKVNIGLTLMRSTSGGLVVEAAWDYSGNAQKQSISVDMQDAGQTAAAVAVLNAQYEKAYVLVWCTEAQQQRAKLFRLDLASGRSTVITDRQTRIANAETVKFSVSKDQAYLAFNLIDFTGDQAKMNIINCASDVFMVDNGKNTIGKALGSKNGKALMPPEGKEYSISFVSWKASGIANIDVSIMDSAKGQPVKAGDLPNAVRAAYSVKSDTITDSAGTPLTYAIISTFAAGKVAGVSTGAGAETGAAGSSATGTGAGASGTGSTPVVAVAGIAEEFAKKPSVKALQTFYDAVRDSDYTTAYQMLDNKFTLNAFKFFGATEMSKQDLDAGTFASFAQSMGLSKSIRFSRVVKVEENGDTAKIYYFQSMKLSDSGDATNMPLVATMKKNGGTWSISSLDDGNIGKPPFSGG